ncbi:conserved exported hypothetical protein [Bradyrhizobium sp. ORS 375]|nr:conserved exported hypothetical protein [Bradyrhizobium sp. ORS 375]
MHPLHEPASRANDLIKSAHPVPWLGVSIMIKLSGIAVASLLTVGLMSGTALAQSAPAADAPAATPSPAPNPSPAEAAPVPAPAATSDKPAETKPAETKTASDAAATKKKKRTKTTRQEVEDSLRSGKVPSRYRSRVPKEYQKYIPFAR